MKKALCIVGPTASGKTALAYALADKLPSVLISADSRHVYRDLTIIAGKDIPRGAQFEINPSLTQLFPEWTIGTYTHQNRDLYMVDVAKSSQEFSVFEYQAIVTQILQSLPDTVLPIIVGGSHFYLKSLLDPIDSFAIPQNDQLRKELSRLSVVELQKELTEVDHARFTSMNTSDVHNPRRLIRAIEVAHAKTQSFITPITPALDSYKVKIIGLTAPMPVLRTRIDARVEARIVEGAIQEAEKLFARFEELSTHVQTANGYKELFEYFETGESLDSAIQKWKYAEYHNAKKQLTWIHSDSRITTYEITDPDFQQKVVHDVLSWNKE